MGNSLRDQLLKTGLPQQLRKQAAQPSPSPSAAGTSGKAPARSRPVGDDLAAAYAARARLEREEREAEQRRQAEAARRKREIRQGLDRIVREHGLNSDAADQARNFEHRGKIRRIWCTAEQLRALNAGELGVIHHMGRYVLVPAAKLDEAARLSPEAVALRIDPNAQPEDPAYEDPRFRVPDDLMW